VGLNCSTENEWKSRGGVKTEENKDKHRHCILIQSVSKVSLPKNLNSVLLGKLTFEHPLVVGAENL
jgi:hypothetical protein